LLQCFLLFYEWTLLKKNICGKYFLVVVFNLEYWLSFI